MGDDDGGGGDNCTDGGGDGTVGTHAKKHLACLHCALGFLGFDGLTMGTVTSPCQKSMDILGSRGR
eukprot:38741-Pyramimonas_sp.AAC.1